MRKTFLLVAAVLAVFAGLSMGRLTAEESKAPATAVSPSVAATIAAARGNELAAPSAVIELRCPWQESATGSVPLGSCEPPGCPAGWRDTGAAASCTANGIWCGAACAVVGSCSRYCVK